MKKDQVVKNSTIVRDVLNVPVTRGNDEEQQNGERKKTGEKKKSKG